MSAATTAPLPHSSAPSDEPRWAADVTHTLFSSSVTATDRSAASAQHCEADADGAAAPAPASSSLFSSSSAPRSPPAPSQASSSRTAVSTPVTESDTAAAESSQPPLSRKRRHRSDDGSNGVSGDVAAGATSASPAASSLLTLCVKPDWIHHSGGPIYSCDLDPTGLRLATAGADHNLCIWALPPLLSADAELSAAPKLLATLGNHLNPVNCVRFSSSGRMLASCSDGSSPVVMLWQLHGEADEGFESSRPFGAEASEDVDRWSLHAQLRGHSADIQDLSFSPDCRLLASASVDNSIIVWDVRTLEARRRLKGHKGWVKGVSWDPLGRYLCSFGDDGSLIVWDGADDWKVKRCLSDDFAGGEEQQAAAGAVAGGRKLVGRIGLNEKLKQIVFSRLSWSADGRLFGASRGFDRVVPVSPVFSRGTWKRRFFYVGHKHPTTVTKFNPRMFTRQPLQSSSASAVASAASSSALSSAAASSSGAKRRSARSHVSSRAIDHTASQPAFYPTHTVCAVGSLDNTISIWLTSEPAPIAHVELFFTQAVVDLAWSADGYTLLACSHDGSVALFRFTQDDLGRALTEEETNAHLHHVYGREQLAVGAAGGAASVVESVTGLEVEALGREYEQRLRRMREGGDAAAEADGQAVRRTTSSAKVTTAEVLAKQKEGQKLDAKGRVRRLLQPVHVEGGTVFSSAAAAPLVFAPLSPVLDFTSEHAATNGFSASSASHLTSSALFDPLDPTPPAIPLVEPSESNFHSPKQRKRDADTAGAAATPSLHKKKKHSDSQHGHEASASAASSPPAASSSSSSFPSSGAAWSARPRHLIPAAPFRPLLCKLPAASSALAPAGSGADACVVEVLHHQPGSSQSAGSKAFTSLVCRRSGVEQWQTLLAAQCSLLQSCSSCLIACCRDSLSDDSSGSVHFLSLTGRRLLPPVHLSAPPAFLCCSPRSSSDAAFSPCQYALVLSSDAQLRVYELSSLRCVQDVSAASLLSSASFAAARLLPDGQAVIILSDGHCWLWEKEMRSWLSMSDGDFFASDFRSRLNLPNAGVAADDGSSLHAMQRDADSRATAVARPSLLNLDARTRTMHTVAHLESQLAASLQLSSSSEYQRWFQLYVQQLVSLANAEEAVLDFASSSPVTAPLTSLALARLQETLAVVLPPLHSVLPSAAGSRDGNLDFIAGVDRLSLLRSVLPVVASSRQLQRMAEWLLRAIKEREQRRAERERERQQAAREEEERDGREEPERPRLPSLFPWLTGGGMVERQSNGFHSSSHSPSPSSEQLNGHDAQQQSSSSSSSKHLQLEQRISGGHHSNSSIGTNAPFGDSAAAAAAAASSASSSSSSFPAAGVNGWG